MRYLYLQFPLLGPFPVECRKTKPKVITLANRNRCKQHNEPIRIGSKYMKLAPSAEKRVWPKHDRFWFGFPLVENAGFVNQSQNVVMQNQSKREITFDTQLKTALTIQFITLKRQFSATNCRSSEVLLFFSFQEINVPPAQNFFHFNFVGFLRHHVRFLTYE